MKLMVLLQNWHVKISFPVVQSMKTKSQANYKKQLFCVDLGIRQFKNLSGFRLVLFVFHGTASKFSARNYGRKMSHRFLHCALILTAQCIVIGPVCVFATGGRALCVCVLWVCYHDNSKLRASIFTKLGL